MQPTENLEPILASHPFLSGLAREHVARLAQSAAATSFTANQYLFHAGEKAESLFLIRQGMLAVEIFDARRGPISVQTLEGPCVLGWSWLVAPYKWCFDARALSPIRAIAVNADQLRKLCEQDHDLGFHLLKRCTTVFAERLRASRLQLMELYQGQS